MNLFIFTEIMIGFLFLIAVFWIGKNDKQNLLFFIFSGLYAILFENINVLLSKNIVGGYFYNPRFSFFILDTPLFIVFSWAIIIYGAKKITEFWPITKFAQPFTASLLVLMIDLSLDTVAIRLNFWTWRGYSLTDGFWGVPANNFLGWLLVSFTFFAVYQNSDKIKKEINRLLFTLVFSFVSFLLLFNLITSLKLWLNLDKNSEFLLLTAILIFFLIPLFKRVTQPIQINYRVNVFFVFFSRWCFHLFALMAILYFKMYKNTPFLLVWAVLLVSLEFFLEKLAKKSLTCGKLCDKIYSGFTKTQ